MAGYAAFPGWRFSAGPVSHSTMPRETPQAQKKEDAANRPLRTSPEKRLLYVSVTVVALLVGMSAYPGLIASTIFSLLGFISLLPLLVIWFLFVGFMALRDLWFRRSLRSAYALQSAAISLFAFGLVVLRVPMRLGFAVSRPAFERFLQEAPVPVKSPREMEVEMASRWFGIYHVDEWGIDARGGTYFRTGRGSDVLNEYSYGFVFQANREGTPFGAAKYYLTRIAPEWHTFFVSSDY